MPVTFQVFDNVFCGVFKAVTNIFLHDFIILHKSIDEISITGYHYFDIHRNNDLL